MEETTRSVRVIDLEAQGILSINDGYRAKRDELSSEGLPFARAGNINDGFLFEGAELIGWDAVRRAGAKVSQAGDVVFTSKGTVGRFALVQGDTPQFVYSPQLCYWRSLDHEKLLPRFLFFWMNSIGFTSQVAAVKGQTDMADYVNLRDQRAMRLPIPPLDEQRRIAAVLGALDDKIEANRRMNATLEALAQTVFHERFGRYAPGDPLPDGWRWRSLDDIATFLNGVACQKYPAVAGEADLPVIKIRELNSGVTSASDRATFSIPAKYHVADGDVLFSWSGTLAAKIWTEGLGALNQHLFKVTSSEFPKWFFYRWLLHHLQNFQRIAADKATTMGHIKRHHLTDAQVVVPTSAILEQEGAVLAPLLEQQIANDLQNRTLAATRDALLPRLLSGALRVAEAEGLV